MQTQAVIFGAIGTFAETSELQRQAFNRAFCERGYALEWSRAEYQDLLSMAGGQARLAAMLGDVSTDEIAALHAAKTEWFQRELESRPDVLRPGFETLVLGLKRRGIRVAVASTTFRSTITRILECGSEIEPNSFDVIVSVEDVAHPKPDPEAYFVCLDRLGLPAAEAVAFEDTEPSLASPLAAGIYTIAVPGRYTSDQDFSGAARRIDSYTELGIDSLP